MFGGPPERVEIEFTGPAASYVTAREWHRSQEFTLRNDGSVMMRLDVCVDVPLGTWILGFGSAATVIAPERLAREISTELDAARALYRSKLQFPMVRMELSEPPIRRRMALLHA